MDILKKHFVFIVMLVVIAGLLYFDLLAPGKIEGWIDVIVSNLKWQ